jgi:hypothetical protein
MTVVQIGGCAYRSSVHVAHAQSIAGFAQILTAHASIKLGGICYQHSSNLPQGRSLWLRARIAEREPLVHYAVSVDSDTAFGPVELCHSFAHMVGRSAIGIAPVIRKTSSGPQLNIYSSQGEPIAPASCGGGHPELWAGGFGLVVFNLRWFRENWPEPFPEPFGKPVEYINQGEDVQMCRSVISRGGRVIPLWIPTTHYDTSGFDVIGGCSIGYESGRMVAG